MKDMKDCFCDCTTSSCTTTTLSFVVGLTMGLGSGLILGMNATPSQSRMRKMAKQTTHTVQEAMDNLRDSLAQYL